MDAMSLADRSWPVLRRLMGVHTHAPKERERLWWSYGERGTRMTAVDRLHVTRECYRAYETGDRAMLERHLSDDFTFYSPADVGIDRGRYFERCWPNAQQLAAFEYLRLIEIGEEVLVTYECTRADGSRFRNTEVMSFDGDRVSRVEVYFGWNLD